MEHHLSLGLCSRVVIVLGKSSRGLDAYSGSRTLNVLPLPGSLST